MSFPACLKCQRATLPVCIWQGAKTGEAGDADAAVCSSFGTARSACHPPSSDLHAQHGAVSTACVWDARVLGAAAGQAAAHRIRAPSAHAGVSREAAAVEGSGRRGGGRALASKVSPNPAARLAEIL